MLFLKNPQFKKYNLLIYLKIIINELQRLSTTVAFPLSHLRRFFIICGQKSISESACHVKLLQHCIHVADASQVLNACKTKRTSGVSVWLVVPGISGDLDLPQYRDQIVIKDFVKKVTIVSGQLDDNPVGHFACVHRFALHILRIELFLQVNNNNTRTAILFTIIFIFHALLGLLVFLAIAVDLCLLLDDLQHYSNIFLFVE